MNTELQSKLVEILSGIQKGVAQTSDFAFSQLPDVAAQYIMFGLISSWVWVVICGSILYASVKAVKFGIINRDHAMTAPAIMVGSVVSLLSVFAVLSLLKNALLVTIAPKVWLIKELADLIK